MKSLIRPRLFLNFFRGKIDGRKIHYESSLNGWGRMFLGLQTIYMETLAAPHKMSRVKSVNGQKALNDSFILTGEVKR